MALVTYIAVSLVHAPEVSVSIFMSTVSITKHGPAKLACLHTWLLMAQIIFSYSLYPFLPGLIVLQHAWSGHYTGYSPCDREHNHSMHAIISCVSLC